MRGEAFDDAWSEGRGMTLESAVGLALRAESNTNR